MINVIKKLFLSSVLLVVLLQVTMPNVYAENTENSMTIQDNSIPFKKDNTSIEAATSKIIIMFVVLFLLVIGGLLILKKYSLPRWQRAGSDSEAAVKIMHVKRLTANSLIFQINIDEKIYTILESKSNIKLIDQK